MRRGILLLLVKRKLPFYIAVMPDGHYGLAMDLRHLRYFLAVAEELSFSKASRRLHIAQPALSRAVKELETALGVRLLERTRHSVALTPAGAVLPLQ